MNNKVTYPSNDLLAKNADTMYDSLFSQHMTEHVRDCCNMSGALLNKLIPYIDAYLLYARTVKVTDEHLKEWYVQWEELPEGVRNKIKRARDIEDRKRKRAMDELETFINRQAKHMANWSDEQFMELEEIAETA